ncbi:hypothetical protein Tsp_04702 [Trichinella spiralis]|uniref:hypothetical protein n=1 Tax=Trichinella spiralis TaxID=6334 RepID=UPI0001EFD9DB|nr:hypothetical protein Tsp_04702 [Trichinella spiralis]
MNAEMDSVITNTGVSEKYTMKQEGMRGCPGKLYTNLDAPQIIRTDEHAEGCREDAHAFYHQLQLNELKRLATGIPRPILEIYDELASDASTSLGTFYFFSWEQARNTVYYSRSKRYPRLLTRRQNLRLTAQQTTTKSGNFPNTRAQGWFFHFCQAVLRQVGRLGLRTDYMNNQAVRKKVKVLMALAFLPVHLVPTGFEIINVGTSGQVEALFQYFQQEWLPATKIPLWNIHGVSVRTNNHLEGWHEHGSGMNKSARKHHLGFYQFLQLNFDEQGKTLTVVQQIDDGYTHGRVSVRRNAAYGFL